MYLWSWIYRRPVHSLLSITYVFILLADVWSTIVLILSTVIKNFFQFQRKYSTHQSQKEILVYQVPAVRMLFVGILMAHHRVHVCLTSKGFLRTVAQNVRLTKTVHQIWRALIWSVATLAPAVAVRMLCVLYSIIFQPVLALKVLPEIHSHSAKW